MVYVGFPNSDWNSKYTQFSVDLKWHTKKKKKIYSKGYIDQGIKERGKLY